MRAAVRAWCLMDRRIDWQALPHVCDLVGITDVPLLVEQLETIRDFVRAQQE